jgi:hypothetical protein
MDGGTEGGTERGREGAREGAREGGSEEGADRSQAVLSRCGFQPTPSAAASTPSHMSCPRLYE